MKAAPHEDPGDEFDTLTMFVVRCGAMLCVPVAQVVCRMCAPVVPSSAGI